MAQETITSEARLPTYPVNPAVLNTIIEMWHECAFDYNSPSIDDMMNQFSDTIETLLGSHGYSLAAASYTDTPDIAVPTYVPRYLIDATVERLVIICPNSDIVMHEKYIVEAA